MITAYAININHEWYEQDIHYSGGSYIYLHGKLEDINGFDLVCMDFEPTRDGIFPIEVILVDGTKYEDCTLYIWDVYEVFNNGHQHGLIVLNNDDEANAYAKKCYENKVKML